MIDPLVPITVGDCERRIAAKLVGMDFRVWLHMLENVRDERVAPTIVWIGVQKGPRYRGDRRSIGTPHFDGLDSDLVFQVARSGCW